MLGTALRDRDAVPLIAEVCSPADLYRPAHAAVWHELVEAYADGRETVPVTLRASLARSGCTVELVEMTDWIADSPTRAGAVAAARLVASTAAQRRVIAWGAEVVEAGYAGRPIPDPPVSAPADRDGAGWAPVVLDPADLAGSPRPSILSRDDGQRLLYPAAVHSVSGEPEAGKTWLALQACGVASEALYLDWENGAAQTAARFAAVGWDPKVLRYVAPDRPWDAAAASALRRHLAGVSPGVAVFDGTGAAMSSAGLDENSAQDYYGWVRGAPAFLAALGWCVVLLDHLRKNSDGSRYARGSSAKLAHVDVAYELKPVKVFGRGRSGVSSLRVTKDRHGHIRGASDDTGLVAMVQFASLGPERLDIRLSSPSAAV